MAIDVATAPRTHDRPTAPNLPGPDLPWWRQLGLVRRDFLGFLTAAGERYGDIFCISPAPSTRIFVLNSADLADEVLTRRTHEFTKSKQTRLMVGKFLGNGLVLSEGDHHARQRRLLQPNFGPKDLAVMACNVVAEAEALTSAWSDGRPVDIEPEMTRLSLRTIRQFLVGRSSSDLEGSEDQDAFRTLADAIGGRFRSLPLPAWIPTPQNLRERRAVKQVDALVDSLLTRSRASGHPDGSMLGTLGKQLDEGKLSSTEVRDQLVTMLFAGHETVAKVLSWTIYLLSRHPDVQHALYAEVACLAPDRRLEAADVPRLKYATNIVRESMRLYPPVWVFDRSPKLPLNLGGLDIHPKDTVYVSPYLLHRQQRYFPEPLRFDPARFENAGAASLAGAYIPFGAGSRGCIGQSMAVVEAVLTIATIVKSFELRATVPEEVRPHAGATLGPATPILVSVSRRPVSCGLTV